MPKLTAQELLGYHRKPAVRALGAPEVQPATWINAGRPVSYEPSVLLSWLRPIAEDVLGVYRWVHGQYRISCRPNQKTGLRVVTHPGEVRLGPCAEGEIPVAPVHGTWASAT